MGGMFAVRSARRPRPTPCRLPARTPRPASHAFLSTRQGATAFNQPLSFDTSSVTNMGGMFVVRSTHALPPQALVRPSL